MRSRSQSRRNRLPPTGYTSRSTPLSPSPPLRLGWSMEAWRPLTTRLTCPLVWNAPSGQMERRRSGRMQRRRPLPTCPGFRTPGLGRDRGQNRDGIGKRPGRWTWAVKMESRSIFLLPGPGGRQWTNQVGGGGRHGLGRRRGRSAWGGRRHGPSLLRTDLRSHGGEPGRHGRGLQKRAAGSSRMRREPPGTRTRMLGPPARLRPGPPTRRRGPHPRLLSRAAARMGD